jgi:hypothetical protein
LHTKGVHFTTSDIGSCRCLPPNDSNLRSICKDLWSYPLDDLIFCRKIMETAFPRCCCWLLRLLLQGISPLDHQHGPSTLGSECSLTSSSVGNTVMTASTYHFANNLDRLVVAGFFCKTRCHLRKAFAKILSGPPLILGHRHQHVIVVITIVIIIVRVRRRWIFLPEWSV